MTAQIFKLQLIAFLHSVSLGLTYPFLSSYMQSLGADHVKIGILAAGRLIFNILSTDFIYAWTNGRDVGLAIFFQLAMLGHFPLILAGHYWCIIIGRCFCTVMEKHSQNVCKNMIVENAEEGKKERLLLVFNVLSGFGYMLGPVIAGYLYEYGFVFIGLSAFFLTCINMCISKTISNSDISNQAANQKSLWRKVRRRIRFVISNFLNSDYEKNWDILAIKFLHVASVTIFCGKFSQVIRYNLKTSYLEVGCAYSYISLLDFACMNFFTVVKDQHSRFSTITLLESCFIILIVLLLTALFSPTYTMFMITCAPIALLNHFIDTIWKDFFAIRGETSLENLNGSTKTVAGMIVPIMFGVLCNHIKHFAVIVFSVVPIIAAIYIIIKYTKHGDNYEVDKKND